MTIRTWAIGGQARDNEGSARLLAHFAVLGRTGILGKDDCRVLALPTPSAGFRVSTGAFSNRVTTQPRQKYVGELDTEEIVTAVPGTDSSGGRHDLVVIRTDNPNLGEGSMPADPAVGPYSRIEVLQGVPFGTRSFASLGLLYSAEELARIEYPASVSTIGGATGNAKIVDLRFDDPANDAPPGKDPVSNPPPAPSFTFVDAINCTSNAGLPPPADGSGFRQSSWRPWPSEAQWQVPFPPWASQVVFYATINPQINLNTWGDMRLALDNRYFSAFQMFDANFPLYSASGEPCRFTNGGGMRVTYTIGGRYQVPADLKGKLVPVRFDARTADDANYIARGTSYAIRGTVVFLQMTFKP